MKRPVFIIIGAILVIVLLAVWIYVLFFGTPKNSDSSFADFNFGDTTNTTVSETAEEQAIVDVAGPERLRQLTTKPVAGYQEVLRNASSTPEVLYIEQGTGHVYSINLTSGEEKRLSGTTIKESVAGAITPNGRFVMIRSGRGTGSEIFIGEISSTSEAIVPHLITENIVDLKATDDNTFLYAVQTANSVVGKQYYPISDTSETLFTIPFREAAIDWGNTAAVAHYAYPKASSKLEGFVYQIKAGKLKRLPIDGFGLSAAGNDSMVLYSKQVNGEYQTFLYNLGEISTLSFVIPTIPEKCAPQHINTSRLVCASILTKNSDVLPDAWYKGMISYADNLWEIELIDENIVTLGLLSDPEKESGRQLDIVDLTMNNTDSRLYFTNKNDNALWLYELATLSEKAEAEITDPII